MAPKQRTKAKIGPLGPQFRGVQPQSAYTATLFWQALKQSLVKFRPRTQIRNPVMFVVWLGSLERSPINLYHIRRP